MNKSEKFYKRKYERALKQNQRLIDKINRLEFEAKITDSPSLPLYRVIWRAILNFYIRIKNGEI